MSDNHFVFTKRLLVACEFHKFENFKVMTWEAVIEQCIEKGYLDQQDIRQKSKEFQFLERVFNRDFPAMILAAPTIKPLRDIDDFSRLKKESQELAESIVQDAAQVLMGKQIELPF
ncbi:hypothetical protein VFDL14_23145 [Vibrio fortis]|uniref:Uncharacterized protein n=2 Tax=Vibrio TaxID=662 RepID=A0A066UZP2_9VIBR|nr:hypothetical protein [Vibrio fortis]KDN29674.1 hypothetical protein VFDL14_23145 [Vibrio fortis]